MEPHPDESALIERARGADAGAAREAFGELVCHYEKWLFNSVLRAVGDRQRAEDLTQDAFLRAYSGIASFSSTDARFSTWLYRVAMNVIASDHRHRTARKRGGGQPEARFGNEGVPDPSRDARLDDGPPSTPDGELATAELATVVREAIAAMRPEWRDVLTLRDLQGLSYEEVASALRIEVGTVRSRLHRARDELRVRLAALMPDLTA